MISRVHKVEFFNESVMHGYRRPIGGSDISLTIINNGKPPVAVQIILVRIYSDVSNAPAAGLSLQFGKCQMSQFFACTLHLDQRALLRKSRKTQTCRFGSEQCSSSHSAARPTLMLVLSGPDAQGARLFSRATCFPALPAGMPLEHGAAKFASSDHERLLRRSDLVVQVNKRIIRKRTHHVARITSRIPK
jgi:hypothetical protein